MNSITSEENVPISIMMLYNFLPKLSDSKKKAATYILNNYKNIVNMNITELATVSETSTSTIFRICNDLGYNKYQEFKINLAQELSNPIYKIYESIDKDDDINTIKEKVFKSNADAIYSTLNVLDNDLLKKAIDLIKEANHIEFYGFGGSSAVAQDASHKFLKIGIKSNAVYDNDLQAMSASLLKPGDLVIAVSHTGRNKALINNLSLAKDAGASIIVITNYGKTPIQKLADINLFTSSKETAFKSDATSSRIAQLTIIDTLFVAIAFENYSISNENISKTRAATMNKKL